MHHPHELPEEWLELAATDPNLAADTAEAYRQAVVGTLTADERDWFGAVEAPVVEIGRTQRGITWLRFSFWGRETMAEWNGSYREAVEQAAASGTMSGEDVSGEWWRQVGWRTSTHTEGPASPPAIR